MTAGIFISYRRDDSRHVAGRLADDLASAFGAESIFRDIEGISLGLDFTQALDTALASCSVMLVLIGPNWLTIQNAQGQRRLDLPEDWIRQEIATALRRNVRVVPVLIEGTPLPQVSDLPDDLKPLVRRQSMDLSDARWRGDLQRLIDTLARVPGLRLQSTDSSRGAASAAPAQAPLQAQAAKSSRKQLWLGMGLGVFGLVALSYWVDSVAPSEEAKPSSAEVVAQQQESRGPERLAQQEEAQPAAARRSQERAAASPDLPDLRGMWRSLSGEVYQMQQNGRQIQFSAEMDGQAVGRGRGEWDGALLRISMTVQLPGQASMTANCNMQLASDHASMQGQCLGPNGQFAAQMFR